MRSLKYLLGLFIFVLCVNIPLHSYAAENDNTSITYAEEEDEPTVQYATESDEPIILYNTNSEYFEQGKYVNEKAYNNFTSAFNSLDESMKTYTFEYGSDAVYSVSGTSVSVSADGVVTPGYTTYYYKKNGSYTSYGPTIPADGYDYSKNFGHTGDSTVSVTIGAETKDYIFTVKDFANKYREDAIDTFMAEYISDDMTEYQKYVAAAKFVLDNYDYSYSYSTYADEALYGGGDCWANTNYMVELCNRLGIKARNRYAYYEGGDGHRNVAALIDDKIYVVEVGHTGTAPRKYIAPRDEGDGYYATQFILDNVNYGTLVQYDGWETELVVPDTVNNYTITAIAERTFARYGDTQYTSIVLPETVTYLRDNCFSGATALKEMNIPRNVNKIGKNIFSSCNSLERITVDENNAYFSSDGTALYNKAKTSIIAYPNNGPTSYAAADTVTTVKEYAFANNSIAEKLTLPSGVTTIDKWAFYNCKLKEIVFTGDKPTFETNAWSMCSATIYYPADNATWAGIEDTSLGNNVKVKFVSYKSNEELASNRVTGNSLMLNGQIGLNFFLALNNSASSVKISGCNGSKEIAVSDLTVVDDNTAFNGNYLVTYAVPVKNMSDSITITVLDTDGNALTLANGEGKSTSYSRSINDYLTDAKTKGGTLEALAVSLEKYGKCAQAYFSGDSSKLPDNIPAVSFSSDYAPYFYDTRLPAGVTYLGMSLVLEDTVYFRYYFSGDICGASITHTPNSLTRSVVKVSDNISYIELGGMPAAKYGSFVSLQVRNWGIINTVFTYGYLAEKGDNQTLKQLCYAMYDCSLKATDYFK